MLLNSQANVPAQDVLLYKINKQEISKDENVMLKNYMPGMMRKMYAIGFLS
jgi:hypothetical protein